MYLYNLKELMKFLKEVSEILKELMKRFENKIKAVIIEKRNENRKGITHKTELLQLFELCSFSLSNHV